MTNKSSWLIFIMTVMVFAASGQDLPSNAGSTNIKKSGKPNIPGSFVVDFGFNQPFDKDSLFDIAFWGSRTVNVYYQYDIRLWNSKFSIVPGIGLSLERYKLKNLHTLGYTTSGTEQNLTLLPVYTSLPDVRKSKLITNYIDIPLELRFSTRPDDPARSFKASIGGRIGYLYDAFTKVNYKENGESKTFKDKQNFNLSRIRYGTFVKIGAGNFSVFAYYNLVPVFEEGEGPLPAKKDMKNFTAGISLSGF